jgi:hypothetical protein
MIITKERVKKEIEQMPNQSLIQVYNYIIFNKKNTNIRAIYKNKDKGRKLKNNNRFEWKV